MDPDTTRQEPADVPVEHLDWTVFKSLSEANAASQRALEEHFFQTQFRETTDEAAVVNYLEEAIERHESILDQLRFARETFEGDSHDEGSLDEVEAAD